MAIPDKITVNAVKAWVEQLPFTNKPVVARETYTLIEQLPHSGLPAGQQMQILSITRRPAGLVLDHIRQRLAVDRKPGDQLLSLGDRYCERLTAACDALLTGTGKKGLFGLGGGVSGQALVLHNHYLEQWYLLHVVSHRVLPGGFWSRCRQHALLSKGEALAPIARLLALHLAGPSSLTARQMQTLGDLLAALPMQGLLTIAAPDVATIDQVRFVWPAGDGAPRMGTLADTDSLQIDLTGLLDRLSADHNPSIDPAMLDELLNRWSGALPDKQRRRATEKPLLTSVVLGLRGVYRHLGEVAGDGHVDFDPQPKAEALSVDGSGHQQNANPFARRSVDIKARVLDISQGGCRLQVDWAGIQNGDIIAVHWGQTEWRIGSLSWISRDGDEWQCGVQWLLEQPRSAMVSFDQGEPDVALIGRCHPNGEPGLIYGTGMHEAHASCEVIVSGGRQSYSLISKIPNGLVELAHLELRPDAATIPVLEPLDAAEAKPLNEDDGVWDLFAAMGASTTGSDKRI